jgi:hypothetical protein
MEQASDNGLNVLEEKLKFDLFIGGESPNEEDRKHLEHYKETVISKEKYPNVYKWRLLLNKHFNK